MPEGDTILRTARTLHAALAGQEVRAFDSPLASVMAAARRLAIVGDSIRTVEAVGKHLLVRFRSGAALHTHQGMRGSWHVYRTASRRRLPAGRPRAVVETARAVALCFRAPVVELLAPRELATHPVLGRLGPDVLKPDFDPEVARTRLRRRADLEIGVALTDQTALAGLGNVYKSEVLFLGQVSPFSRVRALDDVALDRLIGIGRDLIRRNLGPGKRRTTSDLAPSALWVYRRSGRPCRRCGTRIRRALQGELARATYFCPVCQTGTPAAEV